MQSLVFAALSACALALAIAAAQDTSAGLQVGSMAADPADPVTTPPVATDRGTTAPAVADVAASAPPDVATQVTDLPGPVWTADPVPTMNNGNGSDSGSSSGTTDIAVPVTRAPKRDTTASQSQSDSLAPSDTSGARSVTTAIGTWALVGLLLGLGSILW
ncbi:unnamed protein product [Hyaloperonospora brassicae]|uniref:RxLR effector candidate protein n=1 Tax=Hyaloperonospora brassicae TaxID=162125 RepID=A0AAV0UBI3_HYABA|nr:unnamed protein product [Hyaloperonospora brassicae]